MRGPGSREQQLGGDVGERIGLVGRDVHELRRPAAGIAFATRHVGVALAVQRRAQLGDPLAERAGVERGGVRIGGRGHERQRTTAVPRHGGRDPSCVVRPAWSVLLVRVMNPMLGHDGPVTDEPMRIEFALVGTGWLRADLYVAGLHATTTASYLSHALADLVLACALVGEGIDHVECRWTQEPGWALWSFERVAAERVRMRVVDSADDDDGVTPPAAGGGRVLVDVGHDLRRLLLAVLAAVDELYADVGDDGYAERWGEHPFPSASVDRLREAIHGLGEVDGPVPWRQVVRTGAHRWFGVERLAPEDLAVELLVDVMYELANAPRSVCVVEVDERTITLTDDGPGWRVRPVYGVDSLVALLGAVDLPALNERGELAPVAAVSRRFYVETVTGGERRTIVLEHGEIVAGPSLEPAGGVAPSTTITCEPDWGWFATDAGWPVPLPDLVGRAAARASERAWWHPSITDRIVVTDRRR